ncbi:WXG100 family type VII secretion target [Salipaludibacillus agaradhaerens]|jgi:WXG100 family type VII secretion target|uniref:WXG100 family type VII secretion target n=1 Tax=Salipaludibacillus agaradhaerens TaxID=76935 RepID=UPI0009968E0E|nr:WXG100 family type VII secretion target [Salipaludibacillus agaradhaerens]UJW59210.1 WXG100 family type VII secretion target [Bacillus sp. A116_S68]
MAGQIRVTPEELEAIAQRYSAESGNVNGIVNNLDGLIGQLTDIWEGASSKAFAAQYDELKPSFIQMVELLEKISAQLVSTSNALQEADADIASQIRR